MARVLLTGASGFVGANLLAEPGASAHEWTCVDVAPPRGGSTPDWVTESVVDDLSDPRRLRLLVEKARPDAIVHLAGFTGKGGTAENRELLLRANVGSTWAVLDAVAASGIRPPRFLLASSALVYGAQVGVFREEMEPRPADEYAATKFLAEKAVEAWGARGLVVPAILRPAVIYGPGQRGSMFVPALVAALSEGRRFAMTGGRQKRDLVHVRDVARAILGLVVSDASGVFNVGTGTGTEMAEIGRILSEMAGRPDLLGIGDLPYRENESWEYAVDASRLAAATGWSAGTALVDGLRETYEGRRP